jgi:YVTN family beta-propeller protein
MTTSVLLGGALQGIALSRDGLSIMVSSAGGGIWRLNSCTLAVTASAETTAFPTQEIALGPDEREIYVANENGYLDVLDASTLQWLRRVDLRGLFTFGVAVTPDGTQLYVTSPRTGQIGIVDRTSGVVRTLSVGGTPRRIAFDARGSTAVISNEGNWVDIIR